MNNIKIDEYESNIKIKDRLHPSHLQDVSVGDVRYLYARSTQQENDEANSLMLDTSSAVLAGERLH